jgi:hypothetical protein
MPGASLLCARIGRDECTPTMDAIAGVPRSRVSAARVNAQDPPAPEAACSGRLVVRLERCGTDLARPAIDGIDDGISLLSAVPRAVLSLPGTFACGATEAPPSAGSGSTLRYLIPTDKTSHRAR